MNNELKEKLQVVLDYVERWNKQDAEQVVAQAAADLPALIEAEKRAAVEEVLEVLEEASHPWDGNDDFKDLINQQRAKLGETSR